MNSRRIHYESWMPKEKTTPAIITEFLMFKVNKSQQLHCKLLKQSSIKQMKCNFFVAW